MAGVPELCGITCIGQCHRSSGSRLTLLVTSTLGTRRSRAFTFVLPIFVLSPETSVCHCKIPEPLVSVCRMKFGSLRVA